MKPWQKKEKRDAEAFGGKRVKGSGNRWNNPGDVRSDEFLIDSKHTNNKSYSVSLKTWDKLHEEALFAYKIPILSLQIQELELVVLEKDDFLKIKERADVRGKPSDIAS